MTVFPSIDLIICDQCNVILGNKDVITNREYVRLISDIFNHAFPTETTALIIKCKECGKMITTLQRLSYNVLS